MYKVKQVTTPELEYELNSCIGEIYAVLPLPQKSNSDFVIITKK